jgi:hypothetical protein
MRSAKVEAAMKRGINRALRVLSTLAGSLACGHAIIGAAISAEAVTARYAVMVLGPRGACNGAVLAQDLVLTAAHCTTDANLKILGMIDGFLYTLADVQEASAHPRFGKGNPATQTWPDMALLKLRARLPINFGPALLATRAVAVGDRLEIVGRVVTSQRGAPASESAGMAVFTVTSTRNHKSLRRRPLTRRWWTFDLVHTNGSASSL